jgi:hypothetical protein
MDRLYAHELQSLRTELHNLKTCQLTYLSLSVTSTGVILSLVEHLRNSDVPDLVYLTPLVVLLPFWAIFFDKATTITRIVGYYRVLESIITGERSAEHYCGWENALGRFRERLYASQSKRIAPGHQSPPTNHTPDAIIRRNTDEPSPSALKIFLLVGGYGYWILTFYAFSLLSILCLSLSIKGLTSSRGLPGTNVSLEEATIVISAVLIAACVVGNLIVVRRLIWGRYSYTANERTWNIVLGVRDRSLMASATPSKSDVAVPRQPVQL